MRCDPFVPEPYRVVRVRHELSDVTTLELVPVQGDVPAFQPGQFNMLYAFGVGEAAISISGDAGDATRVVHTVRNVGAVSAALAKAEIGAVLGLRGPFGTAWPYAGAEGLDVVFIAGGLGLAPLQPAMTQVLSRRASYGRVVLLYGARDPAGLLYRDEMEGWRQSFNVDVWMTVDHADVDWHGNVGVVPKLIPRLGLEPRRTLAMVCGPEVMMRFAATGLHDAGVPLERIYVSMERNMKCAIGLCGHCQFGADFICKDGPVMRYDHVARRLAMREM